MNESMLFQVNSHMRLMDQAPLLSITEQLQAFPQHYYVYAHTLESLSAIVADIEVGDDILLFANEDDQGLYLQVGLIGVESYPLLRDKPTPKIVYGRKWRIDKDIPTPEVVQTAFLAVQKAKEHEVRELLVYTPEDRKNAASPFSCHQDADLLSLCYDAKNADLQRQGRLVIDDLPGMITKLQFASRPFLIENLTPLPQQRVVVDLVLDTSQTTQEPLLHEFENARFSCLVDLNQPNSLFYRLVEVCVSISNRQVAESFCYKGFARFSENISPDFISKVSLASRPYTEQMKNVVFSRIFKRENSKIDTGRVPHIGIAPLSTINLSKLEKQSVLHGFLPDGLVCEHIKTCDKG